MTSPLTTFPTSNSPFPYPAGTFVPTLSPIAQAHLAPGTSPFPFLGLTPLPSLPNLSQPASTPLRPGAISTTGETGDRGGQKASSEDMVRVLGEVGKMVDRAEEVMNEIQRVERALFDDRAGKYWQSGNEPDLEGMLIRITFM
ncbi:MAG: hypothetical protein TREMPRED_000278 [Tremellales sp. Tagirdzhanova-0007]|nr:MAG: hypothetical protein TREMPRED_000278 [Tremellales sp. Tagirdzhanova-0007]